MGFGEGREKLFFRKVFPPFPNLPLLLPHAKTNGKRAQSHVLNTIYLGQDGGIDDGDVILLTCREMLGQIATDGLNDSGGVAFPPGGETGGHFERLADLRGLGALFGRQVNIA